MIKFLTIELDLYTQVRIYTYSHIYVYHIFIVATNSKYIIFSDAPREKRPLEGRQSSHAIFRVSRPIAGRYRRDAFESQEGVAAAAALTRAFVIYYLRASGSDVCMYVLCIISMYIYILLNTDVRYIYFLKSLWI